MYAYDLSLPAFTCLDKSCLFFLIFPLFIADKTPPQVVSCPKDIVHILVTAQAHIAWTAPVFKDNVGVARIEAPTRKSGEFWQFGETALLQYRAVDTSGNTAKCTFRVTIKCKY